MILALALVALVLTRFLGLNWGFPFHFHPDENNMATSLAQLRCPNVLDLKTCLDPQFYAYGQSNLYLGRLLTLLIPDPNLSLRAISAIFSILTGIFIYKLLRRDFDSKPIAIIGLLLFSFTPVFIQFSHYGTTESALTFFLVSLLYFRHKPIIGATLIGMASAIKVSSLILLPAYLPLIFKTRQLLKAVVVSALFFVLLSPHYVLNFDHFISAFNYETAVATGKFVVFYTQQFQNSLPLWFQFTRIIPYTLGYLLALTGLAGSLLSLFFSKSRLLALVFWGLLLSQSLVFTKWARFLVFSYPFFIYYSVFLINYLSRNAKYLAATVATALVFFQTVIGCAYLNVYLQEDSRLQASRWLQTYARDSKIMNEAANVVDVPVKRSDLTQSFFLYDLDRNEEYREEVFSSLKAADYVVVDSRRVYANYSCYRFKNDILEKKKNCVLNKQFPQIDRYYQTLSRQFKLIKTFTNYPKLGPIVINDELAEETLSVFDHPTVRIFRKI